MDLFLDKEVKIINQSIRGIHYSTLFGEDLDFKDINNLDIDCSYNVLIHKENDRDHLVVLELSIVQKEDAKNGSNKNQFHIVVEGHYEVLDSVKDEKSIERAMHFASLPNLISFLRNSVRNITSMTYSGSITLPLINMEELHRKFSENQKKQKELEKLKSTKKLKKKNE